MQPSMRCREHATKYEVLRTCKQGWGVKGMQAMMKGQRHEDKYEVSKNMQPSIRCRRHVDKYDVLKAGRQVWGVEEHASKYEVSKACR